MRLRDFIGMLLLRYYCVSLLIIPVATTSSVLLMRNYLPCCVIPLAIVVSLVISESMMRALTDFLLPGNERTWTLWLIGASESTSEQAKSILKAISRDPESKTFLIRMQHVPTLRSVATNALADMM